MGKKSCAACQKSCKTTTILVPEGHFYHEKCFTCVVCHKKLPIDNFFSFDGKYYCQDDYEQLKSVNCTACHEKIKDKIVSAHNQFWHQECFKCSLCHIQLRSGEKVTFDGKIYKCSNCPYDKSTNKPTITSTPMKSIYGDMTPVVASPIQREINPEQETLIRNDYSINYATDPTQDIQNSVPNGNGTETEILPPRADHPHMEFERKPLSDVLASRRIEFGKHYNQSYLKLNPKKLDKGPPQNVKSDNLYQHFHRPKDFSYVNCPKDYKPAKPVSYFAKYQEKKKRDEAPPKMYNKEPIEAAKYPDGDPLTYVAPIDRDDWPGPSAEELRGSEPRLRSSSIGSRSVKSAVSDEDAKYASTKSVESNKEIEFLRRIKPESGVGQVLLRSFEKEERMRQLAGGGDESLDPVSSSRTPSADHEPRIVPRYDSHKFASPSRDLEYRPRALSVGETDNVSGYGRGRYIVSARNVQKPGYTQKSLTLPPSMINGHKAAEWDRMSLCDTDPETGLKRVPKYRMTAVSNLKSTAYSITRHSLPSMLRPDPGPLKIYPYEVLKLSKNTLPSGVDRLHLEQHLSPEEFDQVFQMTYENFYRLAEWKRNDIKKRVDLFDLH